MIFDMQSLFSDRQAITTGTIVSTNVIDRGPIGTPKHAAAAYKADLGAGTKVPIAIRVVEDFAGGTNLKAQIQVSTDEAFTSPIVVAETETVLTAALSAGYQFSLDFFPRRTRERFVRLAYVASGTHTTGRVTAGVVLANEEPWARA